MKKNESWTDQNEGVLYQRKGSAADWQSAPAADDCVLARSDALGTFKGNVTYSLKIYKQW